MLLYKQACRICCEVSVKYLTYQWQLSHSYKAPKSLLRWTSMGLNLPCEIDKIKAILNLRMRYEKWMFWNAFFCLQTIQPERTGWTVGLVSWIYSYISKASLLKINTIILQWWEFNLLMFLISIWQKRQCEFVHKCTK